MKDMTGLDEVTASLVAPEVGGGVEGMEISDEKDFPAKILEISEEKIMPAKILEISDEKDLPSNPLKEIVKTDAEKENGADNVDKVVNGKNGVLKIANGHSSEVKETADEAAVKTVAEGKLPTDISNGEKVSQVNGDAKSASAGDTILEDEPQEKESKDSTNILPTEEDSSANGVNCDQSTDEGQSKEEEEAESLIGDKEESSPVENGVHGPISEGIEEKEDVEVDANGEQTNATTSKEVNLEEEKKSTLDEKVEEKGEEQVVNNETKGDTSTPDISEAPEQSDQENQNSSKADRQSIESSKNEDDDAMEEDEEEVTEEKPENTPEKVAKEEEDSQDGCEAREPNKPEEEEEEEVSPASETDKPKAAVADDASGEEEEELDIDKSLEASLENLERELEEESDEVTHLEGPTREGSVDAKAGENGEKKKDESAPPVTGNSSDADDEGDSKMSTDQNDSEAEEPNAEEALASLAQIEKNTKRILDDDWNDESDSSRKRTADDGNAEPSVKKAKLDSEPKAEGTDEAAAMKKKIKKSLKKLKRSEIEEMIATKCVELLTNKSEVGKLRQQVDSYQETVERWKRRAGALSKQCTDLSTVMRKYITDSKTKGRDKVAPVRITRSVGLQVMTPDQRRLQQQRASANRLGRTAVPSTASPSGLTVSPAAARAPPSVGGLVPGSVTITPTKATTPITKKPSIDVVDLSDDDSPAPRAAAPRPAPPLTRQPVPRNPVQHSIRPRPSFRPQGNQLFSSRGMRPGSVRMGRPTLTGKAHPAPLPAMPNPQPNSPSWKLLPPRPALKISRVANGIVLSWNMNLNLNSHAGISSYQLFAYQEASHQRPEPSLWKKVGDVKALPLPMACTLTQFMRGNKYHFAVRAMDNHSRVGQFSEPNSILLN